MKNVYMFILALLGVALMFMLGAKGMSQNLSFGPFFIFVSSCTAIGLGLDVTTHVYKSVNKSIKRDKLRKLGRD